MHSFSLECCNEPISIWIAQLTRANARHNDKYPASLWLKGAREHIAWRVDAWSHPDGPRSAAEWLGLCEAHELIGMAEDAVRIASRRHSDAARAFIAAGGTYQEFVRLNGEWSL